MAGCIDKLEERSQRRLTNEHCNGRAYSSTSASAGAGRRTQKQARAAEEENGTVSLLSSPTPMEHDCRLPHKAPTEQNALDVSGCVYDWLRRKHVAQ